MVDLIYKQSSLAWDMCFSLVPMFRHQGWQGFVVSKPKIVPDTYLKQSFKNIKLSFHLLLIGFEIILYEDFS